MLNSDLSSLTILNDIARRSEVHFERRIGGNEVKPFDAAGGVMLNVIVRRGIQCISLYNVSVFEDELEKEGIDNRSYSFRL